MQKGFQFGRGLMGPKDLCRPVQLIGINAGHVKDLATGVHGQISYFFRSDQILALIEKAEKK